jgi:hypothetical protein
VGSNAGLSGFLGGCRSSTSRTSDHAPAAAERPPARRCRSGAGRGTCRCCLCCVACRASSGRRAGALGTPQIAVRFPLSSVRFVGLELPHAELAVLHAHGGST